MKANFDLLLEFQDLLQREYTQNSKVISKQRCKELIDKVDAAIKEYRDYYMKQLMNCQVIYKSNPLHKFIEMCDSDTMESITVELMDHGYNLAYNNNEDCYVIY